MRTEVLITNSATALRNKSVQIGSDIGGVIGRFPYLPDEGTGYTYVRYYDIDIQTRFLEIPLLLKVDKLVQKNLHIGLEIGYSLKFFPKDASKATILRRMNSTDLTEEEQQNFRFDYRFTSWPGEDYSYHGRGLCPNFRMFVRYSSFQVGLRYQVNYIDWVSGIRIGEDIPLRIFILSMGYRF